MSTYSPVHTIRTVATREIEVARRSKGIMVTIGMVLILLVAGSFLLSFLMDRDDPTTEVAVVGVPAASFEDSELEATAAADRDEAQALVSDGDVDAAVIASDTGWEVLADGSPSTSVMASVNALADTLATNTALESLGIAPEEFATAMGPVIVTPVDISAGEQGEVDITSLVTALAGVSIIMFTVMLFGANIGGRVTEEKSSRVVEIILATVRPLPFLTGKVLGNVIFGFLATIVLLVAGIVAMFAAGLTEGITIDWSLVPILLVTWLLGMLFFGSLYAAAGAMVQRTEDLQTTQMPVLMLFMATMYVPLFGWHSTDSTVMQVFSWIPPFSIFTAPLTYAADDFTLVQLVASLTIAAFAVVVVLWLVARIYRATILNNGKKMGWVQALRA